MKMMGFAGLNPSYELRPGHEQNLLSPLSSDLPVGRFLDRAVESYFCFSEKIFLFPRTPNQI